jgi:hypothetical protein
MLPTDGIRTQYEAQMISHRHKCIFIHVPKCGGTSIEAHLREHAAGLGHLPEPGLDLKLRREGLAEILNRHPDYFAFTIVRNPFDRFVSTWKHSLRGSGPYHTRPVRDLTLADYARIALEGRVEEQSLFDRYHLLPQVAFIPSESHRTLFGVPLLPAVTCDFIGRFERLDADFREICRKLKMTEHVLPRLQSAPQTTHTQQSHWIEYYDADTIRFVQELYRGDMEAFSYDLPTRPSHINPWACNECNNTR